MYSNIALHLSQASVNISSSLMLSGVVIHPVGVGVANYKFDSLADSYDNVYYSDTWSDIAEHEEELAIGILGKPQYFYSDITIYGMSEDVMYLYIYIITIYVIAP